MMLIAAARALALFYGRNLVGPEHVKGVFPAVAGHRLAGAARAGALQAQAMLRAVPLP
jgi:MoxR-like ATPase